jgi:hypothetical protein
MHDDVPYVGLGMAKNSKLSSLDSVQSVPVFLLRTYGNVRQTPEQRHPRNTLAFYVAGLRKAQCFLFIEENFMSFGKIVIAAGFLVPLAWTVAAPAFAEENGESGESAINETQALSSAKFTLIDAIRIAENETKGKAMDASLNSDNGSASFHVEVGLPDGKQSTVYIDSVTGKVIKMASANDTEDEQADEENQNGENNGESGEGGEEGNN